MIRKTAMIATATCVLMVFAGTGARGALITADATGSDHYSVTDFWGISFVSGDGFVKSLTIDLDPAASSAYFDLDGFSSNSKLAPIIGARSGILISDMSISYSPSSTNPTAMTFNFAPGTFGAGDSFRFSADVDGSNGTSGSSIVDSLLRITMEGGTTASSPYVYVNSTKSVATVTVDVTPPADLYWLNGHGNWDEPTNWTGGSLPDGNDNVHLSPDVDAVVNGPAHTTGVGAVTLGGGIGQATLNLRAGVELRPTHGITIAANGTLNSGTLQTYSAMTLDGGTLNTGSLNNVHPLIMTSGTLNAGSVDNTNAITQSGGMFNTGDLDSNGDMLLTGGLLSSGIVYNRGTWTIDGGAVNTTEVRNTGVLVVSSGSLNTMSMSNSGSLTINGGAVSTDTIDSTGSLTLNDGVLSIDDITNAGNFTLNGGSLITGDLINQAGVTVTLAGTAVVADSLVNHGVLRFEIDSLADFVGMTVLGNAAVSGRIEFVFTITPENGRYQFMTAATTDFTADVMFSGLGGVPFSADFSQGWFQIGPSHLPEPGSLGLLVLGGTTMLARRRPVSSR